MDSGCSMGHFGEIGVDSDLSCRHSPRLTVGQKVVLALRSRSVRGEALNSNPSP